MNKVRFIALVILCLSSPTAGLAATPFDEYRGRVGQAAQMATELLSRTEADEPDEELISDLTARLRGMLPATEDVGFNGEVIHVDNAWLHQPGDAQKPYETFRSIAERLAALDRRLQSATSPAQADEGARERLEEILAQPEYRSDLQSESAIQRWFREMTDRILRFLASLFGNRSQPQAKPGTGTLALFRLLLLAGTAAAVILGLFRLVRRLRERVRVDEEETGAREVLGELIEAGTTGEDLLREAAELAREGRYRAAIRRSYIALLYELERQGRLQLHRAKTNRDYLNELRSDRALYLPVEELTGRFERAWYGEAETGPEDYAGFVEQYHRVVAVG